MPEEPRPNRKADLWEHQPDETDSAFAAFVAYRDMGEDRSLSKLEQLIHKAKPWLGIWSAKFSWVERVRAWDNHMDGLARAQMEKDWLKAKKRHINVGVGMQSVGTKRLRRLDENPDQLSPSDARQFIVDGVKVETAAYGKQEDIARPVTINDNRQVLQIVISGEDVKKIMETAKACGVEKSIVRIEDADHHKSNGRNGKD